MPGDAGDGQRVVGERRWKLVCREFERIGGIGGKRLDVGEQRWRLRVDNPLPALQERSGAGPGRIFGRSKVVIPFGMRWIDSAEVSEAVCWKPAERKFRRPIFRAFVRRAARIEACGRIPGVFEPVEKRPEGGIGGSGRMAGAAPARRNRCAVPDCNRQSGRSCRSAWRARLAGSARRGIVRHGMTFCRWFRASKCREIGLMRQGARRARCAPSASRHRR